MMPERQRAVADFSEFAERMAPAVRAAASLAHSMEGRVQNAPKADESTAVKQALTEADTATQEVILGSLFEHFPGVSLAAEEDTESVSKFPEHGDAKVIIDPIDGTLHSYLEGSGPYAVIVGLAIHGLYECGLVSLPREGIHFEGCRGRGAYSLTNGRERRPARATADGNRILVSHGMPVGVSAALLERGYEVIPACGGAVSVAPMIKGVRAGLRWAAGPGGISIRGRVGVLIAREAGALVAAVGGKEFPSDMETPSATLIVASDPDDLEVLNGALEAGLR
jgi:fructose-1,6-bisphosphatase/inositol monophosphatase family enzyme